MNQCPRCHDVRSPAYDKHCPTCGAPRIEDPYNLFTDDIPKEK